MAIPDSMKIGAKSPARSRTLPAGVPPSVRVCVLVLTAVVCGWKAAQLGYYQDDFQFSWIERSAPHPVLFESGRFVHAFFSWVLYKAFAHHVAAHHLLLIGLHVLVVNELLSLFAALRIGHIAAAFGGICFALFPVFYEALYWVNIYHYLLASLLLLVSLRWFHVHERRGGWLFLAGAFAGYFVACGCVELMWPLCVCFPLMQWFGWMAETDGARQPSHRWAVLPWKGLAFVPVAAAAVGLYLYCNQFANRLEAFGGRAPVSQWFSNLCAMFRTIPTWPVRHWVFLWNGSWKDFLSGPDISKWLYLAVVIGLLGLFLFLLLRKSWNQPGPLWHAVAAFVSAGLGWVLFFLPTLPFVVWRAQMRPRIVYIPWLGASLLLAVVLDFILRNPRLQRVRPFSIGLCSVGAALYVIGCAVIHHSVQDVFVRNWRSQQILYRYLKTHLVAVDQQSRYLFVAAPPLVPTHLNLMVPEGFDYLGFAMANLWGVRPPAFIHAEAVQVGPLETDANGGWTMPLLVRNGSGTRGKINLSDPKSIAHVVLFGMVDGRPVIYDRIQVRDGGAEFMLPAARYATGPFSELVVRIQ